MNQTNKNIIKIVGLIVFISSLFFLAGGLNVRFGPPIEEYFIGIIDEFEVSAGGFMKMDLCKVNFVDGTSGSFSGGVCSKLRSGSELYWKNEFIYEVRSI